MKKRKGRIAQLLVMSVITLAMALSIYRNPEHESLVVLLLLWCYFGWNLWTTQQLAKSRSEAVVELERSTVLIRCVTELSSHEDMDRAINNLLKIVTEYFEGDRSYIVKVDYENQLVHNTYEYAAPGITKEIDNLQQVPLQVVQSWLDMFQKQGMFYISDLDREKKKEAKTYDILKAQNINSLIAVPFKKDGTVIGFFGVDNPRKYYRDFQLLSSIQFFLMNRLEMKDRQEQRWHHYSRRTDKITTCKLIGSSIRQENLLIGGLARWLYPLKSVRRHGTYHLSVLYIPISSCFHLRVLAHPSILPFEKV